MKHLNPPSARWLLSALVSACLALPAFAELKIPNPLIEPAPRKTALDTGPTTAVPPAIAPNTPGAPGNPALAVPLDSFGQPLGVNSSKSGEIDSPRELRERFSTFYVSAVMGNQAILRRNSGAPAASLGAAGTAQAATSNSQQQSIAAPVASPAAAPVRSTSRNESLVVTDGEAIDSIDSSMTLYARVRGNQVTVYYFKDASKKTRKASGYTIVFSGEVDSSDAPIAPPLTLEKIDGNYRQSISVESKTRGASSNSSSSSPAPQQQPLPN